MCLGECVPFVMTGTEAEKFDRDLLDEYNAELGNVLLIKDSGNRIVVSFPPDMDEKDKNNAHAILEESFGFQ